MTLIVPDLKYEKYLLNKNINIQKISHNLDSRINFIEPFIVVYSLFKIVLSISPNLIISYTAKANLYTSIVSRILKIKFITNITGLGNLFLNNNFITNILFNIYLFLIKKSSLTIVQNQSDYEFFKKKNFVSISLIESSGIKILNKINQKKIYSKTNNYSFLMIARMIKEKGILEYIEAAKIINENFPNITFNLIGDCYDKNIINKVNFYHKNKYINYIGHMDNASSQIINHDCIVLPSYREGSSRVLLEACNYSKPIIASDVPGCNNIAINNFNAILCEPKNIKSLVNSINKFINLDPSVIIAMGKNGRDLLEKKFDQEKINKYTKMEIHQLIYA